MAILTRSAYIPEDDDAQISKESSRVLASYLDSSPDIKLVGRDGREETVVIPAAAYQLLVDVLTQMSQGNAVTLVPIHAELTTQEAADILNVSRPYLIKQIEAGDIPCRKIGRHRRIRFDDLMTYKKRIDNITSQAVDDLVAQSEEMGLYN